MNQRVLVSGGSGFVGSTVAQELIRRGRDVTVLDLRKPSFDAGWLNADICDGVSLAELLSDFDSVCHLAAIGDVYQAARDPISTARINVEGSLRLLQASAEAGVRRFIYASTWEVYGKILREPVDETHPCNPDHPYSITKLAGEQLCLRVGASRGISVISLRLGTAYGRNMRPTSVFSRFIDSAIHERPILVEGSGEQSRQFTHTSDIAKAFDLSLDYAGRERVFNITAGRSVSVKQLAQKVGARLSREVKHAPARNWDPSWGRISSDLAQRELNWKAEADFDRALEDLIEHRISRVESVKS